MIRRLIRSIKSLFKPECEHIWDARFRWEDEWGVFYSECVLCGEEQE